MGRELLAGAAYAAAAFAVGFCFGVVRVLLVEPMAGPVFAVALELPVMLAVAWVIAGAVVRRMAIAASSASRLAMGLSGLALLLAFETVLGLALGSRLGDQIAAYATPRGLLTLAGQAGFALIPLLVARGSARGAGRA